jgi:hypothetical protein
VPLPLELIGRRDNDRRRSRLGDIICRLASTNEGEIIATVLVLQRTASTSIRWSSISRTAAAG